MMSKRLLFPLSMYDALFAFCPQAAEPMHLSLHSSAGHATAFHFQKKQSLAICVTVVGSVCHGK